MEHQEIYEWLKELAFKNCDKENREQIFWFFEDILEDEITVEKQEDEIERLNKGIKELDDMFYETFRISQNGYYSISEWVLKEFTDKLQELKGKNKEL